MILRQLFFADNFNFFSQDWKATQTFISHEKRRWLSQALLRAADVGWAAEWHWAAEPDILTQFS